MRRYRFCLGIAFVIGIVLANIMGIEILNSYGVLNTYYLDRFVTSEIDYDILAKKILCTRLKFAISLMVLDIFIHRAIFQKGIGICISVMLGIFLTAAVSNFGIKGILLAGALLFPQWLFYLAACLLFLFGAIRREEERGYLYMSNNRRRTVVMLITYFMIFSLLIIVGSMTESYINPYFLKKILKIF